jgi:hypothetical protein
MKETFDGLVNKENVITGLESLQNKLLNKIEGLDNACGPLYWNILFAIEYLKNIEGEKENSLFNQ